MSETQRCRTCGGEVVVTRDERGGVEQLDGQGDACCDACWTDEQAGQTGITADLLRRVEGLAEGAILDLGSGRYAARSMQPYAGESAAHVTFDRSRVVVWAATLWDGHDLGGVGGDDRYELLARHLAEVLGAGDAT